MSTISRSVAVGALAVVGLLMPSHSIAQGDVTLDLTPLTVRVQQAHPEYITQRAQLKSDVDTYNAQAAQLISSCRSIDPDNTALIKACRALVAQLSSLVNRVRAFNSAVEDALEHTPYSPAGNGLIGGTTWTLYASREPGEPEQRMCDAIKQQSKLAGTTYDAAVDCKHYQFALGMAVSIDSFTDLSNRVAFDDLTNGQFTADDQGLYNKLSGKRFDELGCHSNGAMICLAALENKDIVADHVVLYGPQVTRESLQMWNKLVQDGRVKSVKIYLNQNDPVPGVSIAYADYKKHQVASERPLFQVDALKQTILEAAPRLLVQTFPCERDRASLECHSMAMYRSKVNCTGKPSSNTVPGTAPHGKDDLPEPPLPCDALGAKP